MNLMQVLEALKMNGGTPLYVGGYVRDRILGYASKDVDVEIYGLSSSDVERVLSLFGEVDFVGKSFGVYRVKGLDVDFSLPRMEAKFGEGHGGFVVNVDPFMSVSDALRRRDFTMNAIAEDPFSGEIVDPFRGKDDFLAGVLRVVDPKTFVEDPLRVLRGAQFCARFDLSASSETLELCRSLRDEYRLLSSERVFEELKKMLLKGKSPSKGIQFLHDCEWLSHWPELENLWDIPQSPDHHPEGSVDRHVLQVIDRAVEIRDELKEEDKLVYMLACLLHDVGKTTHTFYKREKNLFSWKDGDPGNSRIVAYGHDLAGIDLSKSFLSRITCQADVLSRVPALVGFHMRPLVMKDAKDAAYRKLAKEGCEMQLISKISEADAGQKPSRWNEKIGRLVLNSPKETCVQGRHLIAKGYKPGKQFGEMIRKCEDIYLRTGITDPEKLLSMAK